MSDFERPYWIVEQAIEPKSGSDQDGLMSSLAQMAARDPTFGFAKDAETGQLIAMGIDELELGAQIDRLGIQVLVSAPQVRYRESLRRADEIDYTHTNRRSPDGQFARLKLHLKPNPPDAGNEFRSTIEGYGFASEFMLGVEKGIRNVWASGPLVGMPMIDTKVTLLEFSSHEEDSSAAAFEIAARAAMREGATKAGLRLMEPIMALEVVTPLEFADTMLGDMARRRGEIRTRDLRSGQTVIRALAPLAQLFGYSQHLNSTTNGKSAATVVFDHFAEVRQGGDYFPPAAGVRT